MFLVPEGLTCVSDPMVQGRLEKSYRVKKICRDISVIKSLVFLFFFFSFLYRYLTVRGCGSCFSSENVEGRTLPVVEVQFTKQWLVLANASIFLHAHSPSTSSSRVPIDCGRKSNENLFKKIDVRTWRG